MRFSNDHIWIAPVTGPRKNYDRETVTTEQLKEIEDLSKKNKWKLSDMPKFLGPFHEMANDLKLGMPLSNLSEFHASVMLDEMNQLNRMSQH